MLTDEAVVLAYDAVTLMKALCTPCALNAVAFRPVSCAEYCADTALGAGGGGLAVGSGEASSMTVARAGTGMAAAEAVGGGRAEAEAAAEEPSCSHSCCTH
jgi:hypothetical protein